MALNTQQINGFVYDANGTPLSSGQVRFTLSHFDSGPGGIVAASKPVQIPIEPDGTIEVAVWPNTVGARGTGYLVDLVDDRGMPRERLGFIQVGEDGPYSLSDLLSLNLPVLQASYISAISQADFDDVKSIANMIAEAHLLPPGTAPSADYSGGVLTFGIPKGDKGDKGDQGDRGQTGIKYIGHLYPNTTEWEINDIWLDTSDEL